MSITKTIKLLSIFFDVLLAYGAMMLLGKVKESIPARIACFFWVQSLVRDAQRRRLLLELDGGIQQLVASGADRDALLRLTGVYHNLLRQWSET